MVGAAVGCFSEVVRQKLLLSAPNLITGLTL